MIFNIVYHTPGAAGSVPEGGVGDGGVSVEVQMAWGGSSIYTFQVKVEIASHIGLNLTGTCLGCSFVSCFVVFFSHTLTRTI